MNESYENVQAE